MSRSRIAFVLVVLVLALGAPARAAAGAQLRGTAVDGEGEPVKGSVIRIEQRGGGFSQQVKTRKNGGFAFLRVPPGQYVVSTADDKRFVSRLEFVVRNPNGLIVGEGAMDGHPELGAGPIPFRGTNDVELTLALAPVESETAYDLMLAFAAPELNALVKLYEKQRYDDVVDKAAELLAEDPEIGEAHYMQGIALKQLDRLAEAASALDAAASRIPDYPDIWKVIGDTRLDLAIERAASGDGEGAREAYREAADALGRALERGPAGIGLLIDLASALDQIDDHERLIPVLRQVLELEPANLQAKLRLAALLSARGDHEAALTLLQNVPDTEKRAAVTVYNVAVELSNAGNAEGALMAARRAAEIDPDLPQPHQLLVQLHLGRGEHEDASREIRRYLELAPDAPEAESYRAILAQIEAP